MNELIDRYVHAVARKLPSAGRDDVARELRATIDDMLEARGARDDDDVRAVLAELGDPKDLAAGYRNGLGYVIGPEVYGPFVETLRVILSVSLPVAITLQLVFADWGDSSTASLVVPAVLGGLQVGVHVVFWTALVFVIIERSGAGAELSKSDEPWTPDDLPAPRQITLNDLLGAVAVLALIPAGLLWQRFRSPYDNGDGPIPLIDPGLWKAWIPVLFAIVAINLAVEWWKYAVGHWTVPLVVANLAVNVTFVAYFALLFSNEDVWNPAYVAELADRTDFVLGDSATLPVVMASIALISIWDIAESIVKLRRAPREHVLLEGVPA